MADCIVRWDTGTAEAFDTKLDRELADAVLEVAIKANWKAAQELRGDGNVCLKLYNWA